MDDMLKLTQVQKDVLIAALGTDGKTTPKELREAVPELARRVDSYAAAQKVRGWNSGGANQPIWKVLRQLEARGLIKRTDEARSGSRVFELTGAGVDVAVVEATKERSEKLANEVEAQSQEAEEEGETLGGYATL